MTVRGGDEVISASRSDEQAYFSRDNQSLSEEIEIFCMFNKSPTMMGVRIEEEEEDGDDKFTSNPQHGSNYPSVARRFSLPRF